MILHLVQDTYYWPFNCCTREVFCLISCKLWSRVWNETCLPSVLNLWGDRAGGQNCGSFGGLRRLAVRFGLTRWQQDESLTMLGIHRQRWKDCKQMRSRCVHLFRCSEKHAFCRPWQLDILRSTLNSATSHRICLKIIGLWNGGCKMTIRRTITTRQEGGGGVAPSPPTLSSFRW